ncbi:hypothetical protein GCM10010399_08940 [Dactylosporangium fulvum]
MDPAFVLVHSYYEQQIPVPDGWDNRPCGYLLFGPSYDHMAQDARVRGWDVDQVPGQHLHQLVDPDAVAARIVTMTRRWRWPADGRSCRTRVPAVLVGGVQTAAGPQPPVTRRPRCVQQDAPSSQATGKPMDSSVGYFSCCSRCSMIRRSNHTRRNCAKE